MEIDHFLITRFNIITNDEHWKLDKQNNPCLTSSWLSHRFELFESYCLPSIFNQSIQKFKWLIYLDIDTPDKYKSKFEYWQRLAHNITPVYVKPKAILVQQINSDIARLISPTCTHIITSRLDNDDALRIDTIEKIQYHFETTNSISLNFSKGYCLSLVSPSVLTKYNNPTGPFLSLKEKCHPMVPFKTVLCKKHVDFYTDQNHLLIEDGRYWLCLVHNRNLANELAGWPSFRQKDLRLFGLDPILVRTSKHHFLTYFIHFVYRELKKKLRLLYYFFSNRPKKAK